MNEHHLKCWPEYFKAVQSGAKTFEVRKADRPYVVGALLVLEEFEPCELCHGTGLSQNQQPWSISGVLCDCMRTPYQKGLYTGNRLTRIVTYILAGPAFGIEAGYVVMGLGRDEPCAITKEQRAIAKAAVAALAEEGWL